MHIPGIIGTRDMLTMPLIPQFQVVGQLQYFSLKVRGIMLVQVSDFIRLAQQIINYIMQGLEIADQQQELIQHGADRLY